MSVILFFVKVLFSVLIICVAGLTVAFVASMGPDMGQVAACEPLAPKTCLLTIF